MIGQVWPRGHNPSQLGILAGRGSCLAFEAGNGLGSVLWQPLGKPLTKPLVFKGGAAVYQAAAPESRARGRGNPRMVGGWGRTARHER